MTKPGGPPPWPEVGSRFKLPDGRRVVVGSVAIDATQMRVNEVVVWTAPEPAARPPWPPRPPAED